MTSPTIIDLSSESAWKDIQTRQNRFIVERREHEKAELHLIDERDRAEQAFIDAFVLIVGREPEFSPAYGYREALQDMEECLCPSLRIVE